MNLVLLKRLAVVAILALTVVLFIRYFVANPQYIKELQHTSPWVLVQLLLVNFAMLAVITVLNQVIAEIAGKTIPKKENFLLSIYSTLANFFGPLQSGPGVRAAYLKTKHGVSLRAYSIATFMYYACFAVGATLLLLIGTRPWWQTLLAVVAAGGFSFFVIRAVSNRGAKKTGKPTAIVYSKRLWLLLACLTLVQLLFLTVRYYIELRSVGAQVSLGQALSYTGSASLALFVSITPDGIGIREAFLMAAQRIHGVSTANIVSANLIDRAFYLVYLGLIFLIALATHAGDRFKVRNK
ncbi:MAG: lysylphosphatidylglycerol synthase domain-containing protein [Candidatus Saccharimonadales bacterium]